MRNSNLTC